MSKNSIGLTIYFIIICSMFIAVIGYGMYRMGAIFPPDTPTNLEELATWSEPDLMRLLKYYNCSDTPVSNVPNNLKELSKFCSTVRGYWVKEYRESKYDDAYEGAKRLKNLNRY